MAHKAWLPHGAQFLYDCGPLLLEPDAMKRAVTKEEWPGGLTEAWSGDFGYRRVIVFVIVANP